VCRVERLDVRPGGAIVTQLSDDGVRFGPHHPDGTDYRIIVRHGDPAARALHEELGFADGWGSVTKQLAGVAEREAAR